MVTLCGFGVSNYYNKLKLAMLEKGVPFQERLVYPWQREEYLSSSPLGKIPFVVTESGPLSESQVIFEYLEERYPQHPLYPVNGFARAKSRELIQHLELNAEWVARRLYKQSFFGGSVSEETKSEAYERLTLGLQAIAQLATPRPYFCGARFGAADCVAYVHFVMIRHTSMQIWGEDLLARWIPQVNAYMDLIESRPHVATLMHDRAAALAAFLALNVKYDG
jgi:glutathione S-transferase